MHAFDQQERDQFRDTVRRLLADRSASERVRQVAETPDGFDEALWAMLGDLGALGLLVPEEHGGLGGGLCDAAVVAEELGYRLSPVPYLSSAVLAVVAFAGGQSDPLAKTWLPALAGGSARAAVALGERPLSWSRPRPGSHRISGSARFVLDAPGSDVVLLPAEDDSGEQAWFAVPTGQIGVVAPIPLHDITRRAARLDVALTCADEHLLAAGGTAGTLRQRLHDTAACLIAWDAVGSAQRVLDLTVDYVKTRRQFGHPVGAFQAVKHGCTDMYLDVVAARAAAAEATEAVQDGAPEASLLAAVARSQATRRGLRVAGQGMQLHGGIGFTWENDMHLHLKRASLSDALYGSRAWHEQRVAALVLSASGPGSAAVELDT